MEDKITSKMQLRLYVLLAVRGNTDLRVKIRQALHISPPTLTRLLKANSDDLTKIASLMVISEELNLPMSEIVEPLKLSNISNLSFLEA